MANYWKKRMAEYEDFETQMDELDRFTKKCQEEELEKKKQKEHELNIRDLLSVRIIMRRIDFQTEFNEYMEIEDSNTSDNQDKPTTEFIIEYINDRILYLFEKKTIYVG